MKRMLKRLCTGFLALATIVTALPTTPVHAESKQYWTESAERVGIIEKVMNDGSIGSTFNEGYMKVEGETAYCIDINTDFKNGYKTRADASSRMSADQISDVALSLEYVKQYGEAHKELNYKQDTTCARRLTAAWCFPISGFWIRPAERAGTGYRILPRRSWINDLKRQ